MMTIVVDDRWRVDATACLDVPLRASAVWGQMRDLRHFLTIDPLHRRVRIAGAAPPTRRGAGVAEDPGAPGATGATGAPIPVGTALVIEHRLFGIGVNRRSRLLRWREGSGFAVSDLSSRGDHAGFPHVCIYEVVPLGDRSARLTIAARGRWTATWMPRWLVRLWLAWVMASTLRNIRVELWRFRRAVGRRRAVHSSLGALPMKERETRPS